MKGSFHSPYRSKILMEKKKKKETKVKNISKYFS